MGTEKYTHKAFDKAAHVIPDSVRSQVGEIMPAAIRYLDIHKSEPETLMHNDVHIGNWYQTGEGRMGVYDWQLLTRGHWSRDVAYAISSSLTRDDRRAWERDLLKRYIERFAEHTGTRLDFDQAFRAYRQQIVLALLSWTITLCHSPFHPNMQPEDMSLAMIERMTGAMDDLDSLRC
jgi:aminoglycoside phosphotransferase (APT) family kinase protein